MELKELTGYLDNRLNLSIAPNDHSNNGLQVEGSRHVKKALFSVDASLELFERAAAISADFIFVHHGISWDAYPKRFTGSVANRLTTLFKNDISLYAVHLPLDAHPEIGHNALLADMLDLVNRKTFCKYSGIDIGVCGELQNESTPAGITTVFEKELHCSARIFGDPQKRISSVGIVSGGGGMDGLAAVEGVGLDCYVTGEFSHTMYHPTKESGIPVITLGHYKSETPGVMAVMRELNKEFDLECVFVDIPTGL